MTNDETHPDGESNDGSPRPLDQRPAMVPREKPQPVAPGPTTKPKGGMGCWGCLPWSVGIFFGIIILAMIINAVSSK